MKYKKKKKLIKYIFFILYIIVLLFILYKMIFSFWMFWNLKTEYNSFKMQNSQLNKEIDNYKKKILLLDSHSGKRGAVMESNIVKLPGERVIEYILK